MANRNDYILGVDIGGSHITCCAVDLGDGRITDGTMVELPVDSKAGMREILKAWAGAIDTVIEQQQARNLRGIGFAMPGPFDYQTGIANFAGSDKFKSLYGVHIETELTGMLRAPAPMRFINDATAFAIGAAWRGAAQGYKRSIAITLGTGFGSAFVEDGIPVVTGDHVPQHGCLWHLPYQDGIADDYISTRWFEKEYLSLTGQPAQGVKDIAEQASKDSDVAAIFERFGTNLGEILAPWVGRFQSEALILGGNVAGAVDLFATALTGALDRHGVGTDVEVCPLGATAALLGAARLFENSFWRMIEGDLPRA